MLYEFRNIPMYLNIYTHDVCSYHFTRKYIDILHSKHIMMILYELKLLCILN